MGLLAKRTFPVILLVFLNLANVCLGARKLTSVYQPPSMALTYHKGTLLEGNLNVSILWYGKFSPPQKSIIVDFLLSLNAQDKNRGSSPVSKPLVSHWWKTIQTYMKSAGKKDVRVVLAKQLTDTDCSLGKNLKKSQISSLVRRTRSKRGELTLVLTAHDVAVEGFCMSNCGFHSSVPRSNSVFIWVGNSITQCPGQCAWPFHQPIYGPQTPPLGAPNGDVGMDGIIINIATLLSGAVTNPYGNGYFMGPAGSHLEAATACAGVYGKGAYPGYAGDLLLDRTKGGSYNSEGVNGRKYLLPALFDPVTSQCSTFV